MANIYQNISELVGNTPLVQFNNLKKHLNLKANIIGKVEYFNPAGSVKDRIANQMIQDAINDGLINQDTILIEPTSGNTGIGLAAIAASLGLKLIIVMPDTMSIERRKMIAGYGAELVLTPGSQGMKGAIAKATELASQNPNSWIPSQFENPNNPKAHYLTTGPEIYRDTNGEVDVFVAGIGTGGTISGIGKYLKEQNKNIEIIGVEPTDSPVITKGQAGPHKIQGIGAGFIPDTLDTKIYDQIITIDNESSFEYAKLLAIKEGISVGISSGAALKAAIDLAKLDKYKDKNIIVLLPDTGARYLSTPLFD